MLVKNIILVANSPGELAALVRPIAQKFREKLPEAKIYLFITPCQYSSGREVEYAEKNLTLDGIVSTSDYKRWLIGKNLPFDFNGGGVVLFLGGDLLHATLISKKLGFKAYAYLAGSHIQWRSSFAKFFVPNAKTFKEEENIFETGDLMTSAIEVQPKTEAQEKWHIDPESPTIAFMPGSRTWEIKHTLPLYEKIIKKVKKKMPDLQTMLIIAPFVTMELIESQPAHTSFDIFAPFKSITAADLAITIPGTNTAQIAAAGVPEIMLFPLDKPQAIPIEGLLHYVTMIPGLGLIIKKLLAYFVNKNTKFFALPNVKADFEIVPEIRGKIKTDEVVKEIHEMISDKRLLGQISKKLKEIMGDGKAADRIVETIINENLS